MTRIFFVQKSKLNHCGWHVMCNMHCTQLEFKNIEVWKLHKYGAGSMLLI